MPNDYNTWLDRAKSSLAISIHKSSDDVFYEDLCFQAQQAVEKAFKGLLIFYNVAEPERTHNLVSLIKELSKHTTIPDKISSAVVLNDYAVNTRYPGVYTPISEEEYKAAILMAEECVRWVMEKIEGFVG